MKLIDIQAAVNTALAGDMLTYREMIPHLNYTVDQINAQLNAKYPSFAAQIEQGAEYTAFPDRYIRMVVVPGAAWHYYVNDEEGMSTAPQYQIDFQQGLFLMLRDMCYAVPAEYQESIEQGSLASTYDAGRGVWVNDYDFTI